MATRVDWSSLSLRKNPLSDDFVGSSPTSATKKIKEEQLKTKLKLFFFYQNKT